MIDLHVHTTASDGSCRPAEVVQLALAAGLSAIAITDHDTTAGFAEAEAAARESALRVICGIEISADYCGTEVHVLGYFLDPASPGLRPMLDWAVTQRAERNQKIVQKLAARGLFVDLEALARENPNATIGRPHIAQALMRQGAVSSIAEAFSTLLGEGQPCYAPRRHFPFAQAVQVIQDAGGLSVLAHPLQYHFDSEALRALLSAAREAGIRGMETDYAAYSPAERAALRALAADFQLLSTGGTDFHGSRRPGIALGVGRGDLAVPDSVLTALEHAHRARKTAEDDPS